MKYPLNVDLIRNYLWEKKLTKKCFCQKCKISVGTLNKLLNNQLNVRVNVVLKIAKVMKVQIKEFFIVK